MHDGRPWKLTIQEWVYQSFVRLDPLGRLVRDHLVHHIHEHGVVLVRVVLLPAVSCLGVRHNVAQVPLLRASKSNLSDASQRQETCTRGLPPLRPAE